MEKPCSSESLVFSRLLLKNVRIKTYKTKMLRVVLYGQETWLSLISALRADRLETALAESHVSAKRVASCIFYLRALTYFHRLVYWYVLRPLQACDRTLRRLVLEWRAENSATFLRHSWGLRRPTQAEPGSLTHRAIIVSSQSHSWMTFLTFARRRKRGMCPVSAHVTRYTGQLKKKITLPHVYNEVTSEPTITRYASIVRKTLKVLMLPHKHSMWEPRVTRHTSIR
jgi:hypothetical protein